MERVVIVFICLGLLPSAALARTCNYTTGEERWEVKTSVQSVTAIQSARVVSLASLIALRNPPLTKSEKKAIENTLWPGTAKAQDDSGHEADLHEGDIVRVTGYVYRVRCQRDGDFHMEVGVGNTRKSQCMIMEVPDPTQIRDPKLRYWVSKARDALAKLDASVYRSHPKKRPIKVTITGQLFLDAPHFRNTDPSGGRGSLLDSGRHCASNLWEIHPVVEID